jgi:lipoprotein-anchoring transpeptidase ErfK/SrfK
LKRLSLAALFLAGFLLAGGFTAAVVAETLPTTTTGATTTAPGTTTTTTTTTPGTTTTTPAPPPPPAPATLADGVRIGGVEVGGLDPDGAAELVLERFMQPLRVRAGARRVEATSRQLGATAYVTGAIRRALKAPPGTDVELVVAVQGYAVRDFVEQLASTFDRAPVDARLRLRDKRPFVTKDVPGRRLERLASVALIVEALRANQRREVALKVKHRPASVTRQSFGPVIVIHRGAKQLKLYRGMKPWRTFGVATGQTAYPTPLGRFQVIVMWRNPWWYPPDSDWAEGLEPVPPGPGNPLGTRWMGISVPGVGIHGTPDAASIGYSASHGCVRMRIPEAEWLFNHVEIGTTVFIVPD